jgi:signal transduction histidine kinase
MKRNSKYSKRKKRNSYSSIKDNGIGIDKDSGAKLFNLFHRAHRDTSRFEGIGVGLALCKNIAEKYHGKIWFESEVNRWR